MQQRKGKDMAAPENNPDILRNFSQFLTNHEGGALVDDLTKGLRSAIADLTTRGSGKAEISVKFVIRADNGLIEVEADHSVKLPKKKRGRGIYWPTPENNLARRDPSQMDFGFKDVSSNIGTTTIKTA